MVAVNNRLFFGLPLGVFLTEGLSNVFSYWLLSTLARNADLKTLSILIARYSFNEQYSTFSQFFPGFKSSWALQSNMCSFIDHCLKSFLTYFLRSRRNKRNFSKLFASVICEQTSHIASASNKNETLHVCPYIHSEKCSSSENPGLMLSMIYSLGSSSMVRMSNVFQSC